MNSAGAVMPRKESDNRVFIAAVCGLSLLFMAATSFLALAFTEKFDSPDETANYVMAKRFATDGSLTIPEPLLSVHPLLYPRSFAVRADEIVSGSFLGLILLYGSMARVVGTAIIPFLTPVLSGVALFFFALTVRKFFGATVALLASVLLALHPAFWYFVSRGLYHNALFLDLLLIGVWALGAVWHPDSLNRPRRRTHLFLIALAGMLFGAAVAVRTSEVPWAGLLFLGILIALRRQVPLRWSLPIGGLAFMLPLTGIVAVNARLFGQPLATSYTRTAIETGSIAGVTRGLWDRFALLFFPFGIDLGAAARHVWQYGIAPFWIPATLTILGMLQTIRRPHSRAVRTYLIGYGGMIAWLVLYYGSWTFSDNPGLAEETIGISYVRYWLPLYVFGLPFAALFLLRGFQYVVRSHDAHDRSLKRALAIALPAAFVVLALLQSSLKTVLLNRHEGLATIRAHTLEYRRIADTAARILPQDAVIIAGSADKIFFPERRVLGTSAQVTYFASLRALLDRVPVYVYVSPVESPAVVEQFWRGKGFRVKNPLSLSKHEVLFLLENEPKKVSEASPKESS